MAERFWNPLSEGVSLCSGSKPPTGRREKGIAP